MQDGDSGGAEGDGGLVRECMDFDGGVFGACRWTVLNLRASSVCFTLYNLLCIVLPTYHRKAHVEQGLVLYLPRFSTQALYYLVMFIVIITFNIC